MSWLSTGRTNYRTGQRSIPAPRLAETARVAALLRLLPAVKVRPKREAPRNGSPEDPRDESVAAVHSMAGRHHALDGGRPPYRLGDLPGIARLRIATSRLPHDSSADVLSRSQSRCNGLLGYRSARAPVRPDTRPEPDDLDQLFRQLDYHSSVRSGFEH